MGRLGQRKTTLVVRGTRGIGMADMRLNNVRPEIEVDPETFVVRTIGEILTCASATELPFGAALFSGLRHQ